MREKSLKPTGFTLECESRGCSSGAGDGAVLKAPCCLHHVVIWREYYKAGSTSIQYICEDFQGFPANQIKF